MFSVLKLALGTIVSSLKKDCPPSIDCPQATVAMMLKIVKLRKRKSDSSAVNMDCERMNCSRHFDLQLYSRARIS